MYANRYTEAVFLATAGLKQRRSRHIPPKPEYVSATAAKYWDMYTNAYDFEDVEALQLASLCNQHAIAEYYNSMSFNKEGMPLPFIPRKTISGDPDDRQSIPNPFIEDIANVNREIERLKSALGIQVGIKVPIQPSVESPVDKAGRKKAEKVHL